MATTKDPMFVVLKGTRMFATTVVTPDRVFYHRVDARTYANTMNLKAKTSRSKYRRSYTVKRVLVGPTSRKK
jgi:hypothetical protein